MNPALKLQVLVAHDEPLLAAGLEATLLREDDMSVTAMTPTLREAASVDARDPIDVILADCRTGIRLAASMRASNRVARPRIVIVTHDESEVSIRRAMEAGVRGYLLLSSATRDSVVQAVRCAARGGIALDPIAATRMADSLNGDSLTTREREVLGHVMLGMSNKVVAARLGISVGTVKCHVKRLLVKLDANTRTEAAAIAQRRGLITERSPARPTSTVDRYSLRLRLRDMSAHS